MQYLLLAPTGIAANNINGQTIHSALHIAGQSSGGLKSNIFQLPETIRSLEKVKVLVIDEISMVNTDLFEFISSMFARLHKNIKPFGNVHVLCLGDLMQLPPVTGRKIFYSSIWKLFSPVFLSQSIRQQSDPAFFTLLNDLRFGLVSDASERIIQQKVQAFHHQQESYLTTYLVSYRNTATNINNLLLNSLPESVKHTWNAIDREEGKLLTDSHHSRTFKSGTNYPSEVTCVPGAKVMFLNNSLLSVGISNGTCGVIVELRAGERLPTVAFPTFEGIRVSNLMRWSFDSKKLTTTCG